MKRQYQIEQQRAVQQFRRIATEQNPNIQMILPLADMVGLLQEGVGNLLRHAGLELMHMVMDEGVKSLAGERLPPPNWGEDTDARAGAARLTAASDWVEDESSCPARLPGESSSSASSSSFLTGDSCAGMVRMSIWRRRRLTPSCC